MKRAVCILSVVCLMAISLGAVSAIAKTYPVTMAWAPTHIITKNAYLDYAKAVNAASKGEIELEVYTGGSMLPPKETLKGVASNVAVLGMCTGAYTPADLPLSNVINDISFINKDATAAAFAVTEINFFNPDVQKEWAKNGVVFGGGYSTPIYHFITTTEFKTAADVKGKKIRTAGGAQADFVQSLGGVPVSMPFSDIYSGMERGSLDGTMADATALSVGAKLWEVAKSVNLIPMGTHTSGATWIYNQGFWSGLSPAQRRLLFDQMALAVVRMQLDYERTAASALEGSKKRNLAVIEPDETMQKALADFKDGFVKGLPKDAMETRKVADPTALIQQYLTVLDKWEKLIAGVDRTNEAALLELLKKEVYDKLDEKTYGVK